MLKDWKDLTDDEILNFAGSQTADIARYQRIMEKKTIDALLEVRAGLFDVKKSMHIVTEKIEARLLEFAKLQRESAVSQRRLQRVTIALTVVIALSTVVYTWITWQSVQAQREANRIQREAKHASVKSPSNSTVERDAPKAARLSP